MTYNEYPHRRYNLLTDEWVLVSPHRSKRPWQGQIEKMVHEVRPQHDPDCYLCAGNQRANGERNPDYNSVFVFDNDFAALLPEKPTFSGNRQQKNTFFISKPERGLARVVCFSPRHDLTVADMATHAVEQIVQAWIEEYKQLGAQKFIHYIQIFENKGVIMGCSNPHPHGQIWAQESIPVEPLKKQKTQKKYWKKSQRTLLSDYLKAELEEKSRILFENEHFVTLVPYWAVWPFEAMIVPRRPMSDITEMNTAEQYAFADAYRQLAVTYDKLFQTSFPYSAGIHQAPTDGKSHPEWHWHMIFYPPLLRSSTVKKFMVGYEMLANPQRDITPETAAQMLRECM